VTRIVGAGLTRVVAAIEDPNPVVQGQGFAYLRAHGVEVDVGVRAAEAAKLNQPFFTLMREHRPFVMLKAATSLDGCLAAAPGHRTKLTSAASDRHAHSVRAEVDAIGVGSGTILTDDPQLTPRGPYRERPLARVIFDRRLRTPPAAAVLSTCRVGPVIIVTTAEGALHDDRRIALESRGAVVDVAANRSFRSALERLAARGIASLVLEGGAGVHAAAWDEGLVDFVRLYVTPQVLGLGCVPLLEERSFSSTGLIDRSVEPLGADVLIEGYVHRPR
jgi:diaminohydroxyphosphoribosylaminopyrimidine deaminase/5-amino-6-(5-phosphoribosylamino)uracil reductase